MKNITQNIATEFIVSVDNMRGDKRNSRFGSFRKAYQYYLNICAEKGIDDIQQPVDQKTAMDLESGGRGYDYRITLTEEEA